MASRREFGEAGKHLPPTFDKSIDGLLGLAGKAAEGRNQLPAINGVLRTAGVEIAARSRGPARACFPDRAGGWG
jgi:hypothetical protein